MLSNQGFLVYIDNMIALIVLIIILALAAYNGCSDKEENSGWVTIIILFIIVGCVVKYLSASFNQSYEI